MAACLAPPPPLLLVRAGLERAGLARAGPGRAGLPREGVPRPWLGASEETSGAVQLWWLSSESMVVSVCERVRHRRRHHIARLHMVLARHQSMPLPAGAPLVLRPVVAPPSPPLPLTPP